MAFRVAVASSDGIVINQHFGHSKQFLIFEITDEGKWSFIELRQNTPPCLQGNHDENDMQRSVELLSDCSTVLVSKIGPGAEYALKTRGITAYSVGDFIENALKKLIDYEHRQKKH